MEQVKDNTAVPRTEIHELADNVAKELSTSEVVAKAVVVYVLSDLADGESSLGIEVSGGVNFWEVAGMLDAAIGYATDERV